MSSKGRSNRNRGRSSQSQNKPIPITRGTTALAEREVPVLPFDERIVDTLLEASTRVQRGTRGGSGTSKAFSLAWDETEAMGITADMRRSGPGMLSDQDRKETLYQAYLNNVWISACVDVIAKRITSGGMVIELTEKGTDNQAEYDTLHEFLHYINDDEDFLQLIRSIATDLLIYGECYMEIVNKAGKPFSLHKIDCSTMNYQLDKHGNVIKYIQNMNHSTETVEFTPDEVVRWWLPDPKANKKALSPIERILGPTDTDTHMADWARSFFRKGARPPFWIKFPGSKEEATRFVVWLRENYTGMANAHIPMVLYDDSELHEIGKGAIDMDFSKGREMMRQEILAGYQVPPAAISQIESGNIGGGTGESQDKSLQFNACDPVRYLIFEKFTDRVIKRGFGITNWRVNTRYADFRSDLDIIKIDDTRIRNGSSTINEVRAETGKQAVDGGDESIVVASRDIIPTVRLKSMADEQAQQTQLGIQQSQAQLDMTKVQIDKAKNPPPPPPVMMPNNNQPQQPPTNKPKAASVKPQEDQQERYIHDLQYAVTRVNEALTRADEHLRAIREEKANIPPTALLSTEEKQHLNEIWQRSKSEEESREWFQSLLPRVTPEDRPIPLGFAPPGLPVEPTPHESDDQSLRIIVSGTDQHGRETKIIEKEVRQKALRGWRPSSTTQQELVATLSSAIKAFISTSQVSKDGVTLPEAEAREHLLDVLQDTLRAAVGEGKSIVTGQQEESIVSAAKNIAGRAISIINDIVDQIREKIQDIIDSIVGSEDIDPDEIEQEIEDQVDAWAADYSDMVATTEIQDAVESSVVDALRQSGAKKMQWFADPDACPMCQQLADAGPIDITDEWEGGITSPPAHPNCGCTVGIIDESEDEEA